VAATVTTLFRGEASQRSGVPAAVRAGKLLVVMVGTEEVQRTSEGGARGAQLGR
jgi:hypothetical protein